MTCDQVEELRQLRKEREEWRKEREDLLAKIDSLGNEYESVCMIIVCNDKLKRVADDW